MLAWLTERLPVAEAAGRSDVPCASDLLMVDGGAQAVRSVMQKAYDEDAFRFRLGCAAAVGLSPQRGFLLISIDVILLL